MHIRKEPLWIGDRYRWGNQCERNSTSLAGFFYDNQKGGDIIALTVRPPSSYESEYANRIEIIDGLLCLLSLDGEPIDRDKDQETVFRSIGQAEIPFRSTCELIAPHGERISASVVGINRAIRIRGNVYRGLYELNVASSVIGMAGAPIIRKGELVGLIVGDGGRNGDFHCAYAAPTHNLRHRLWPLPRAHKSDRAGSDLQAKKFAQWADTEEIETEAA